jgi:hypothetical protein
MLKKILVVVDVVIRQSEPTSDAESSDGSSSKVRFCDVEIHDIAAS